MKADDIIVNGIDEDGNKVEIARVVTDVIEVEYDTDIEVGSDYQADTIELTEEEEANVAGVDAVGINLAVGAAFKLGAQVDVSLIGVVNGKDKGAFGITVGANLTGGVEAGVDLFNVSFYFANDISTFELDDLAGIEMGVQGSFSGIGGSAFRGVKYKTQSLFYKNSEGNTSMRSPR